MNNPRLSDYRRLQEENAELRRQLKVCKVANSTLEQENQKLRQHISDLLDTQGVDPLLRYKDKLWQYAETIDAVCVNLIQERTAFMYLCKGGTIACRKYLREIHSTNPRRKPA